MDLFRGLTFAENLMCIYRNYLCINKNLQILVIIHIIAEIAVSLAITGNNLAFVYDILSDSRGALLKSQLFQFLVLLKNMVITIGSIANTGSHKIFLDSVNKLDTRFENEPTYLNSLKNLKKKCLVISILFGILATLLSGVRIINAYYLHVMQSHVLVEAVVFVIYKFWIDIRYMLEHLVAYSAITLIYEYVKCLNSSIHEILEKYSDDENGRISLDADEVRDINKKISYWAEVYPVIMESSKHFSKCFNGMIFLSLVVAVLQTVSPVYEIICLTVMKMNRKLYDIKDVIYILLYHMAATMPLLFAGQKLQNEFSTLNIALATLANEISIYDQKSTIRFLRDLNRIVTTNPIVIKIGTFALGMYLLPTMLSLSATYIVVLLQFNHVI